MRKHRFEIPIKARFVAFVCLVIPAFWGLLTAKLQKVQNNSAKLICRTPNSDHISPVPHTLHWLPVERRIEYKLLLLAFKSVNNDGPSYTSDLLKFYIPSRQPRSSSDTRLLRIPSFRLRTSG